jgi:hypothetical protein
MAVRSGVDTGRVALPLEPLTEEQFAELELPAITQEMTADEALDSYVEVVRAEQIRLANERFQAGGNVPFNLGFNAPNVGLGGLSTVPSPASGFLGTLGGYVGLAGSVLDIYDRLRNDPAAAADQGGPVILGTREVGPAAGPAQQLPVRVPPEGAAPIIINQAPTRQQAGTIVQGSTRPTRGRWTPIVNAQGQVVAWRKLPNRMNVLNPQALGRAMRRVSGFATFSKRAIAFNACYSKPKRRKKVCR